MSGTVFPWRTKAEELAGRISLDRLHPAPVTWLRAQAQQEKLAVACSGGADSLCLLLLVWAHWPEARERLLVLHFDHRLRGEESRGDAAFVFDIASALGVGVVVGEWEKQAEARVTEETARRARMEFFRAELAGAGINALLLGHQRDDIVETQLMRLSRGSGTAGLAAPRPVQLFPDGRLHLRPLLSLSAAEIRLMLKEINAPFRQDATNAGPHFYRNQLRRDVLPGWQKHSPFDVAAGAAAARELLEEDDVGLRAWLRELLPPPQAGEAYSLAPLAGRPRALMRRALVDWLAVEGLTAALSKASVHVLLAALEEGRSCKMSGGSGAFVVVDADRALRKLGVGEARLPAFSSPWPLPLGGTVLLPGGRSLEARLLSLDDEMRARIVAGGVDARRQAYLAWDGPEVLQVRNWLSGDTFRQLGSPGARKLQDIFVDRKICEEERYLLPVVVMDTGIAWVPCLPPAENMRVQPATKQVVRLTYNQGKPV